MITVDGARVDERQTLATAQSKESKKTAAPTKPRSAMTASKATIEKKIALKCMTRYDVE
jgi:hypothetical protein